MTNINDYEMVKDRIPLFFDYFVDGRIITEVISESDNHVTIKASLYSDREEQLNNCPISTGIAREVAGGHIDKYTENCETSAIGRALANRNIYGEIGQSTGNRPSREEMVNADVNQAPPPQPKSPPVGNYDAGEIASAAAFGEEPQMQPPKCPTDGSTMLKKDGRNGSFWGCPQYSNGCRQTMSIGTFD